MTIRLRTSIACLTAAAALAAQGGCGRSRVTPNDPAPNSAAFEKLRYGWEQAAGGAGGDGGKAGSPTVPSGPVKWSTTLTGRFVLDGAAPAPVAIKVDKDQEVCGKHELFQEDMVVGAGGELANVMIYVTSEVPVNPDYDKTANGKVTLDNHDCHFVPHIAAMRAGQTLHITNSDPVGHNTKIDGTSFTFNQAVAVGGFIDQKANEMENIPAPVSCSIHPWMKARLLIRPNPYFAVSGKDGRFEIKNLPAGSIDFQVYHERAGYIENANFKGQDANWKKGKFTISIDPDKPTDWGDIKLSADQFNK